MKARRFVPRRYQLTKNAARIVESGHPWVFRSHLSSATQAFGDGQWLRLVGPDNHTLGFGIFEAQGLIGIRVLKRGSTEPDLNYLRNLLAKALEKRSALRQYTDAFRALHGENDKLPGVVVDIYGGTAVLQTYAPSVDSLGRWAAGWLRRKLGLAAVVWKIPAKRKGGSSEARPARALWGRVPERITFREGKLQITVAVGSGQKSGTFLDLRALRKWLTLQKLAGKRVLNLFSYTGTLGLAAEVAGAREIWNVDIAKGALDFAKSHHARDPQRYRWVAADVFEWLSTLPESERFDVVIVDPPNMASDISQVPTALRAYKRLYAGALAHLAPGGTLVGACCTSRIARKTFEESLAKWMPPELVLRANLRAEDDHPVGFPEGDYLKILIYEAKGKGPVGSLGQGGGSRGSRGGARRQGGRSAELHNRKQHRQQRNRE